MSQRCADGLLYAVRPGETLKEISQRFDVSSEQIREANPGAGELHPAEVLCIPGVKNEVCPHGFLYRVEKGDSLFNIGRRFGVSLQTMIDANEHIPDAQTIFPGEEVCVPTRHPSSPDDPHRSWVDQLPRQHNGFFWQPDVNFRRMWP